MEQQADTLGLGVRRGVLCGAALGALLAAFWSRSAVSGEDARTLTVTSVGLGAFAGSVAGGLCGTLVAVVHQSAQRFGSAGARWVAAVGALVAALVTAGGFGLWPLLFPEAVPPGLRVGWIAVCAVVAAWQVRRVQHRFAAQVRDSGPQLPAAAAPPR
ncbi:hypothetical protein MO973_10445 [Paenibacillus sp. TRM 82003]|uniref:hypothetical protein n=1 Tax=Kineococcus sp. TRM81007 TaxID=2925831 RepID=UPI001F56D5A9|nr:hypothetical protein [Kineococcus sp. TRM81007]MCI2237440.1 hypothetical protein [Kineococcus sp. TRM81007]MCI3920652.1 hypothetical protein [Paenibacillus sp. TRM 82003]